MLAVWVFISPLLREINALTGDATCDDFLGGAVRIFQPIKGYRAGIDPVLLAASIDANRGEKILDVGCGTGVASLCLAARVPAIYITGIEIVEEMADLARASIAFNHLNDRMDVVQGNIYDPGILAGSFDQVISNPPYFDKDATTPSAVTSKAYANMDLHGDIDAWVSFCFKRLKSGGVLTVIFPTQRLHHLMRALMLGGGDIQIMPFFPKEDVPSKRVIVRTIKGSKKGVTCHRGLVLHKEDGSYQEVIEGCLRRGEHLSFV